MVRQCSSRQRKQYYRQTLHHAEMEVKFYSAAMERLQELSEDIVYKKDTPTEEGSVSRYHSPGDPTSRKATQLYDSLAISHLTRSVRAIDQAVNEFTRKDANTRLRFVQLRFWDNAKLNNSGIAQALNIAESTVRSWRSHFLEIVAGYMGWPLHPPGG